MTKTADMSSPHAQQYPTSKPRKRRGLRIFLKIFGGFLVVLALAVAALLVIPFTEVADHTYVSGSADWMESVDDEVLLSDMVIPGTHDSATKYCELAFITKCQALTIGDQLAAGFRYLDIRLGDDGAGNLLLYHGFTHAKTGAFGENLTLDAVLDMCYAFLKSHPTETIIFAVKQEHGDVSVAEFQRMLDAHVQAAPDKWLLTGEIPTLGEARGKLVLMRRYEDAAGLGEAAGIPLLWVNQNGHDDVTLNVTPEDNGSYTLWVQDRYEYGTEDKWTAFMTGMETAADQALAGDVRLHFLSTKGTFVQGHPYAFAKDLNDKLMGDVLSERLSGWIIVDFGSAKLAKHIYKANEFL
ncbi:MAG: phosphatidylinositol-specific phospholipase C domain-containing protein [Eggerthellaceae bacterium]|nr:phosphatidylinositol-specific phospholipase C domain-containing protein [Eggerthellaceae bacterium]